MEGNGEPVSRDEAITAVMKRTEGWTAGSEIREAVNQMLPWWKRFSGPGFYSAMRKRWDILQTDNTGYIENIFIKTRHFKRRHDH
jgi:hypothetical protein